MMSTIKQLLLQDRLRALPWLGPLVLLVVFLWHTWPDPDIWCHLTLGRGIVEQLTFQPADNLILRQESYVNVYWLFQLIVWGAHQLGGVPGVTALFLLVWGLAFALWGACARLRVFPGVPIALLALLTCHPRFLERPEVFSQLFVAGYLLRLSRLETSGPIRVRELALWATAQAAWTNMHGYFLLGPAVTLIWAVSGTLPGLVGRGSAGKARDRWVLPGVVLAATFLSPFGTGSWGMVRQMSGYLTAMRANIVELAPYALGPSSGLRGLFFWAWIFFVTAVGLDLLLRRRKLFEPALVALGVVLAMYTRRNAPLAVFMSAPALGAWLSGSGVQFPAGASARRAATALNAALAIAAVLFCAKVVRSGSYRPLPTSSRFGVEVSNVAYPVGAMHYLRDAGFAGKLFNHPSDGGYLSFHLPSVRLYSDSRFTEVDATEEYFRALVVPQRFLELDQRHLFDAVLVSVREGQDPILPALTAANGWELAYADLYRGLFVNRRSTAARGLPRKPFTFYSGEDLANSLNVECAVRWLGILERLRRPDLAIIFLRQLEESPQVPSAIPQTAKFVGLGLRNTEIQELAARLSSRHSQP